MMGNYPPRFVQVQDAIIQIGDRTNIWSATNSGTVPITHTLPMGWDLAVEQSDTARRERLKREQEAVLKATKVHVMGPKKARWR
jgi:hypothetical protein